MMSSKGFDLLIRLIIINKISHYSVKKVKKTQKKFIQSFTG